MSTLEIVFANDDFDEGDPVFIKNEKFKNLTVLVGSNGSGKSTILRLLSSTSNTTLINGRPVQTRLINDDDPRSVYLRERRLLGYSVGSKNRYRNVHASDFNTRLGEKFASYFERNCKKTWSKPQRLESFKNSSVSVGTDFTLKKWLVDESLSVYLNDKKLAGGYLPSGIRRLMEIDEKVKGRKHGEPYLVLFDEVDNHLHPSWIHLLARLIESLAGGDVYVILSTHNTELLYALSKSWRSFASPSLINNDERRPFISFQYIDETILVNRINEIVTPVVAKVKKRQPVYPEVRRMYRDFAPSSIDLFVTRELASLLMSNNEDVIVVEGTSDQLFLRNKTYKNVITTFGWYKLPVYIAMFESLHPSNLGSVSIVVDGDADSSGLKKGLGPQYKIFHFKGTIENDVFGVQKPNPWKGNEWDKFSLLLENWNTPIPLVSRNKSLFKILDLDFSESTQDTQREPGEKKGFSHDLDESAVLRTTDGHDS